MMVSALSSTATENATDVSKPEVSGTVTNEYVYNSPEGSYSY
jgi:hypothetical protein